MATTDKTATADGALDSDAPPIIAPLVVEPTPVVTPPAPDPLPPPVDDGSVESRVIAAVRAWQTTFLTNSPVSRAQDCWSHVDDVLGYLVTAILQEV